MMEGCWRKDAQDSPSSVGVGGISGTTSLKQRLLFIRLKFVFVPGTDLRTIYVLGDQSDKIDERFFKKGMNLIGYKQL